MAERDVYTALVRSRYQRRRARRALRYPAAVRQRPARPGVRRQRRQERFRRGHPQHRLPNPNFTCEASRISGLYQAGLRLGLTFNNWLLYASGGYATGSIETRSFNNATRAQFDSTVNRHGGWYLGGGIEYGLNRNIVLGLEYQHIALDGKLHPSPFGNAVDARSVDADADVIRARLTWLVNFERYVPEPLK